MSGAVFKKRTMLVLPAVLLTVSLLEDLVSHVAREHVKNVTFRVLVTLALKGAAFAVAAHYVSPWIEHGLVTTRRGSFRHAGTMGLLLFYAVAYGLLYWAYLVLETKGAGALLPRSLR